MFDEQEKKVEDMFGAIDGGVPANLPFAPGPAVNPSPAGAPQSAPVSQQAPVDMPASNVDLDVAVMPRQATPPPPPEDILSPQNSGGHSSGIGRLIGVGFVALVSIGLVVGGVYLGLQYVAQQKVSEADINPNDAVLEEDEVNEPTEPSIETPVVVPPEPEPIVESPDTDGDGLSDAEEDQLGTDLTLTDTDADGLNDAEEVRMYGTDPLNQDTDGDGFVDGVEVANGFNPNGSGRLFQPLPPREEDK